MRFNVARETLLPLICGGSVPLFVRNCLCPSRFPALRQSTKQQLCPSSGVNGPSLSGDITCDMHRRSCTVKWKRNPSSFPLSSWFKWISSPLFGVFSSLVVLSIPGVSDRGGHAEVMRLSGEGLKCRGRGPFRSYRLLVSIVFFPVTSFFSFFCCMH
ncbi:hypothetical protein B0T19DRAFT_288910 [Cercophora scortea]|uniref:Transmembrane protein n=1 Tax=Cercophora scortea TaxID=314031 RepID=A0AAE0M469_9PEZI|nr:hypothetical protein B0T19DRAFT_288910 [Cercophora scortea]